MRTLIWTLIFLSMSLDTLADNTVFGRVVELANNSPIPGANVLIKTKDGKLLVYGTSGADGKFSITLKSGNSDVFISVTMIGFKPYSAPLNLDGKPLLVRLEDGALQLKEVTVKADRIRENGDTITYNVGSFAQKQDVTIGDVLKRMPGIEVAKNGKIQYQGSEINKFYIEGNDLLGGKYGIATNGINHDDVGAVEVMENHQPMQVLNGLGFTDKAAINLKLKNKSKATLLLHGFLAGGLSGQQKEGLWQGDIFTMMVMGKYQMLTTFKGNNTGVNLSEQLVDFTSDKNGEKLEKYVSLTTPSTPNLQSNRSYFNNSRMVSSSHLLKTKTGDEIKAQVDYSYDCTTSAGAKNTTYFLDSGDKVILEDKSLTEHRNVITGRFSYEANKKTYFLNNTLETDFSYNDMNIRTLGTVPNIQNSKTPEYSVSNMLKMIKRFNSNILVTFTSRNEWNSLPEKLTVINDGENYGQRLSQHSFYSDERASLGFVFGGLLLSLDAGATGYFRNLNTELWGFGNRQITGREDLTTDYLRVFATPKFEWKFKKVELSFNIPLNMYSYFFSGGLRNRTEMFLSPSLAARFSISSRMSFTLRGSARRSPAALHDIHESSILTNYRSFGSGVDDYYASSGQSLSAVYSYRSGSDGIFIIAMGSYGWNQSKFGTVQDISGNYVFHSYRSQPSDSKNAMAFFNVSKTLDFMRGAVGLKGNLRRMDNSLISQGVHTEYRSGSYTLSPFINGNISSFLNWNLRFTWERSVLKITGMENVSSGNFVYSGSLNFTPCQLITWTAGGEFYRNEIDAKTKKETLMLDTKLTFNVSKSIEIAASLTNLLNNKNYIYTTYGTVSKQELSSRLRGRELLISVNLKK